MVTSRGGNHKSEAGEEEPDEDDSAFRDVLREVARADARTPPIYLPSGTPLGPYRLVDLLGRGGMGVVYRALDSRLEREVALKVLRGNVSGNERRRRFFREARSAASVNHPNVATVYEVGESGEHLFIAMELIEGLTLRRRLASGALGVHSALPIIREIVLGLAAAHAKGIVHRDLKPENVMLTRGGQVKILDFGLAKMRAGSNKTPDDTLGHRETETLEGVVLGTPAYMAPEQASGQRVDARADVFALGIVLYELVTGVRPGLLGSGPVIEDEQVAGIVHRCIATSPAARFADASAVLEALDTLSAFGLRPSASSLSGDEAPPPDSMRSTQRTPDAFTKTPENAEAPKPRRNRGAVLLAGALAVTLLVSLSIRQSFTAKVHAPSAIGVSAFPGGAPANLVETRLTFYPPEVSLPTVAVSFDGRNYAYSDNEALWLATVDGSVPRQRIALPPGEKALPKAIQFFPDGKRMLVGDLGTGNERTWILSLEGKPAQQARDATGFAMSPDGEHIAFKQFGERVVVGPLLGGPTTFIESVKRGSDVAISWSPDGRRLAIGSTLDETCIIQVARADGSSYKTFANDQLCRVAVPRPVWTANDRVAFQTNISPTSTALVEVALDANDAVIGAPRRLWSRPTAQLDAMDYRNGRFFFVRVESQLDVYVGRLDAQRKLERAPTRFTMDDRDDRFVGWMPDGRVVYTSQRDGLPRVFSATLGDPMSSTPLGAEDLSAFAVLPDGDVMGFRQPRDGGTGFVSRMKQDGTSRDLFPVGPARIDRGRELRCAQCARKGRRCVVGEVVGEETSFYEFDPEKGQRGSPFAHLPSTFAAACSLSEDGSELLLPRMSDGLKIVAVATGAVRSVAPPNGGMIQSINGWPGSGDFIGTAMGVFDHDYVLARFNADGSLAEPLWTSDSIFMTVPLIAPNGRDIALTTRAFDTDVYMLEPADAK